MEHILNYPFGQIISNKNNTLIVICDKNNIKHSYANNACLSLNMFIKLYEKNPGGELEGFIVTK